MSLGYDVEITEAIQNVVKARKHNDRVDAKNALIALVDERAQGNKRVRQTLMGTVQEKLDQAFEAEL